MPAIASISVRETTIALNLCSENLVFKIKSGMELLMRSPRCKLIERVISERSVEHSF